MSMYDDPQPCPRTCDREYRPRHWCDHCWLDRVELVVLGDAVPHTERESVRDSLCWARWLRLLREVEVEAPPKPPVAVARFAR